MFDIDSRSIFLHEHDAVGRFLKKCTQNARLGPQWNFKGPSSILLRTWINVNCFYLVKTKIAFFVMQSTVQCLFRIKMTAICLKMAAKFKMAAKIEFVYINWLGGLIINITTTPYYLTVTFYLHHAENITHNTKVGIYKCTVKFFPADTDFRTCTTWSLKAPSMSHPTCSLFASPMLPIVNPEILGIARFFYFLFMFTHVPRWFWA